MCVSKAPRVRLLAGSAERRDRTGQALPPFAGLPRWSACHGRRGSIQRRNRSAHSGDRAMTASTDLHHRGRVHTFLRRVAIGLVLTLAVVIGLGFSYETFGAWSDARE